MALLHLSILSIFLLTIIQIHGYPGGAPKKACTSSMLPRHKHYTPQPPSTSPIATFNSTWNPDGETIAGKRSISTSRSCDFSFSDYRIEGTNQRYFCPRSINEWH